MAQTERELDLDRKIDKQRDRKTYIVKDKKIQSDRQKIDR